MLMLLLLPLLFATIGTLADDYADLKNAVAEAEAQAGAAGPAASTGGAPSTSSFVHVYRRGFDCFCATATLTLSRLPQFPGLIGI